MKFFTLELYEKLYDNESDGSWSLFDKAVVGYQNRLLELRDRLHPSILEFAGQSLIADALLSVVRYDRKENELDFTLRCVDPQGDYYDLVSHHKGAEISIEGEFALATVARATRSSQKFWGYDGFCQEVDVAPDGRIEHGFLFHRGMTFTILCTSLEWERIPCPDRTLPRMKDRFPGGPPTPPPSR